MDIKYRINDEEMIIQLPKRVESEDALRFEKEMYCIIKDGIGYKTFSINLIQDLEIITGLINKIRS